ncbi:MAG: PxKF domain-containing protein, partial [Bacteroidota bacterium]
APVLIGAGGRVPPSTIIEDDATGDVETSGVFDPASDGIDFYESLEGMLVQLNDAVAVGPTSDFGSNHEIPVVGDNGVNASVRTARGGVIIQSIDFNPERIILNDWISGGPTLPPLNVGDSYPGTTVGVMDYSFGNYKLQVISLPPLSDNGLQPEETTAAGLNQLSTATFNVENLSPNDPQTKFDRLAGLIVNNLKAPDVLAIEEIQDNNGAPASGQCPAVADGTVDATQTWSMLIAAIQSASGLTYEYRQIDPQDCTDGGAPGGNIRQGFLFRTDRGLSFIDRPGASATTANAVVGSGAGAQLLYSPGRIEPTNTAFNTSRKPLAGEFLFNGHHLFVVANHFNSKGGDNALFGHFQPPTRSSEVQRHKQAQVEHDFINAIVTADPNASVVVMGDLNDFEFSDTVSILKGTPGILNDLMDTLPLNERYSYVFDGNSQTLDHTLFSNILFSTRPFVYDVVHVNSEFADQASDHEPQVSRITLNDPPTVDGGGPYSVVEGQSVSVSATGTDLENDLKGEPLTYAWDLDNDGSFETPGQSVLFTAPANSAPATYTIKVQATDNGGLTAVDTATVSVLYNFNGFFQPVDNLPVFNSVKAGQAIPVKFSLTGDQGLNIFDTGYPKSESIACNSTDPVDGIEETVAAGGSSLSYDPISDTYTYVWKTDKAWASTCRQLVVKLNDGSFHRVNFKFTK